MLFGDTVFPAAKLNGRQFSPQFRELKFMMVFIFVEGEVHRPVGLSV
jgi:hypothetical protein